MRIRFRMRRRTRRALLLVLTFGLSAILLTGCDLGDESKYTEPWNDAPRGKIYHFDGPCGSVSVTGDPTCPK